MTSAVSSYSPSYTTTAMSKSSENSAVSTADSNPFEMALKDAQSSGSSEAERPVVNSSTPAEFSAHAMKMMQLRGVDSDERATFKDILVKAKNSRAYDDPKSFLNSLSSSDMEVLRQVHSLGDPIRVDGLDHEGAYNLLLQPGDAKDLNNDGLLGVGIGKGWVFPPPNAPIEVKKAFDEATAGMTDGEKMMAMTPFMTFGMGEAGYKNPYVDPDFSYTELVEKALSALEVSKNLNTAKWYQDRKEFLTDFLGGLERSGVA